MSNDNDDDIRAIVRRAAQSIEVRDCESQVLARGSDHLARPRGRLIPFTIAAAIGAILLTVALIRTAGTGPTDGAPAIGAVTATSQKSFSSLPPSSGEVSAGATEDGWTTGTEISSAIKDGVPVAELRKIATRTAQLLQDGDVQGLLGLQRPDSARTDLTAEFVDDLGGHPTRATIYFDAKPPADRFASVAFGVDCETSGLRASVTLKFGVHEGAWYLNLAAGVGGVVIREGVTPSDTPPSALQQLSCGQSK